jgi:hypothetical protein
VGQGVTVGLIPFHHPDKTRTRLTRDVLPTFAAYPDWQFEVLVADNSPRYDRGLADLLADRCPHPHGYKWNNGLNLQYARAMNLLAAAARHPVFVYVCAAHGRMLDPGWLADLVAPLADPRVAMAGTVLPVVPDERQGFLGGGVEPVHVQGGVFAARTDLLRRFPYDPRFPHLFSDVWVSWKLQREGYQLADVPAVRSVWTGVAEPGGFKYVHDYAEGG